MLLAVEGVGRVWKGFERGWRRVGTGLEGVAYLLASSKVRASTARVPGCWSRNIGVQAFYCRFKSVTFCSNPKVKRAIY
jgi:hypothetical protein